MSSVVLSSAPAKYEPIMTLGGSATSEAFLAVARGLGGLKKLVVLKELRRELACDEAARTTFLAEARSAAWLNHPNIAQVNEVIERRGVPVIVTEYLEGRSLAHVLETARGQLPLTLKLRVIADALVGLHHAHELRNFVGEPMGLVHRNVSPQNIFVTFEGAVKLLDFGIPGLCAATAETTRGAVVQGQLQYISPEQVSGTDPIDRRADLFAMGVILWEVVTGEHFWTGSTPEEILPRLLGGEFPSQDVAWPDVPSLLESTCSRALARDPADRYATAEALRRDIEAVISQLGGPASNRELGTMVSGLFAGSRAEMKAQIDERLRSDAPSSAAADDVAPSSSLSRVSFTSAVGRDEMAPLGTRRGGAMKWLAAGAGLLLAAATVTWPALPAMVTSMLQGPPAVIQVAPPERVRTRFAAFPPATQLWLDGKPISNPSELVVERDGELHQVRAEAMGYGAVTREVAFLNDVEVVLNLQPLPAPAPSPSPTAAAAPLPRRYVAPAAPQPARDRSVCEPPYYIDARGVKKYKPRCL